MEHRRSTELVGGEALQRLEHVLEGRDAPLERLSDVGEITELFVKEGA